MTKKEKLDLIHTLFDSPIGLSLIIDELITSIRLLPYNFGNLKKELPYLERLFEVSKKVDLRYIKELK